MKWQSFTNGLYELLLVLEFSAIVPMPYLSTSFMSVLSVPIPGLFAFSIFALSVLMHVLSLSIFSTSTLLMPVPGLSTSYIFAFLVCIPNLSISSMYARPKLVPGLSALFAVSAMLVPGFFTFFMSAIL